MPKRYGLSDADWDVVVDLFSTLLVRGRLRADDRLNAQQRAVGALLGRSLAGNARAIRPGVNHAPRCIAR